MRFLAESVTDPDFCTDLSGYYPIHDYIPGLSTNIGLVLLVAGLLNVFMSLVTVIWIRRQRYLAQEETDNDEAVNSVIFPVFVRLLWLSVTVNIISGVSVILVPLHRAGENTPATAAIFGFVWAMQHGVLEGVAFLLMQKGCGQHAAKRARMWSFWWISFVFVLMFCAFYYGSVITTVLSAVRDGVLVLFYFVLYFAPEQRLFRRPAALFYSKCWLIYRAFFLLLYTLMFLTHTEYLGNCGTILLSLFVFAVIQPLIMYTTLLRDSLWWQGVDIGASRSGRGRVGGRDAEDASQDIRGPLQGSEYSLQSAQALAGTVDDMRVRGNVTMLNFACIKLHSDKTLGAGSFSKVYKGTYRGKDCAIKLIYTVDITAETIKKVAAEDSILSSIRNKNIVNIMGVSVLPPSVCLILELCSFGSLSDLIRGYGFDWSASHRAPLQLSHSDIVYLALGCARGLAAVHSYDSTLCHRDVKSFNFLVDHQFNVKIADLELGFMTGQEGGLSAYDVSWRDPYAEESIISSNGGVEEPLLSGQDPAHRPLGDLSNLVTERQQRRIEPDCVNVNELLANWLAPEVILERKFQQASDVFALGTVLWEVLSAKLPFDGEHPATIRRKIVSGYTHPVPATYVGTAIAELVQRCWAFDPKVRPSSQEVASALEGMLRDQCYKHFKNIESIPDTTVLRSFYDQHYRKSVYGDSSLHKVLFADLHGPSLLQYINPMNWIRYLYNVYTAPKYRGLSVDDNDSEGSVDSSLSDSRGGTSEARDSLHRRLFEGQSAEEDVVGSDGEALSRSSYVMSEDRSPGAQPMYAQLPRAALDVIGVIKEEAYWDALEKSGVAWAVTTIDAPYIVMHATSAWYKLFNVPHGIGSYHHMYSIMSLIGRDSTVENATGATLSTLNTLNTTSYTSSNAYVNEWKEPTGTSGAKNSSKCKSTHHLATNALLTEMHEGCRTNNYKEVHGVLCFSLANKNNSKGGASAESPRGSRGSFSVGTQSTATVAPQGHNLMSTLHIYPIFATSLDDLPESVGSAATAGARGGLSPGRRGLPSALPVRVPVGGESKNISSSSSSVSTAHRSLVSSSPMRETFTSALTANLASVNTGSMPHHAASAQQPQETPFLLRRSLTQTPPHPQHDTPSPLRRTNTQVSHASFASSIRTSLKPDTPRPLYYAIQFHELSESVLEVVGEVDALPPCPPSSPRSFGAQSPETTSGGILGALLPLGIGRFWSAEKKSGQLPSAASFSGRLAGSGSSARSGEFHVDNLVSSGRSGGGGRGSRGSRDSRHSVA